MAQQLAAFRPNTRQRIQPVGSVAIANGTQQSLTFPQVGLLGSIFIFMNATVSDAAASPSVAASTFGPWNMLKRITGITNLGTATIFDLSGYGAYQISKVLGECVEFGAANTDTNSDSLFQYPVTGFVQNTAKPVTFVLMIPVDANDGDQFQIGLINLQAPEIRFTLQLTFSSTPGAASSLADVYNTGDTLTLGGNCYVYYEYYEVPNPAQVMLPPRILHRLLEDRTPISAAGDVLYTVPRQGILLQMIHNVILNGQISKNATDVVQRRLVFNKTDTPYKLDYIVDRILARKRYGLPGTKQDLPGGMFIWDFFDAQGEPSKGDLRDAIDSEALSTLESYVTLSSGVTLGSGNNFLDTIRRITQQY
jgi:hypothetical protein